ncbi:MAG: hypothetical protein ABSD78_18625 [Acidimicrobiales bacterium]
MRGYGGGFPEVRSVEEGLHQVGDVHAGRRSRDGEAADAEVGDELAATLLSESCIATDRERALLTLASDRVEADDDPHVPHPWAAFPDRARAASRPA